MLSDEMDVKQFQTAADQLKMVISIVTAIFSGFAAFKAIRGKEHGEPITFIKATPSRNPKGNPFKWLARWLLLIVQSFLNFIIDMILLALLAIVILAIFMILIFLFGPELGLNPIRVCEWFSFVDISQACTWLDTIT